jgi:hypothetical protein
MSAASDAKIPAERPQPTNHTHQLQSQIRVPHIQRGAASPRPNLRAPALTWEVVEEGDRDGAADDGVHPEPPSSPEDGPGHAWPDDPPQQRKVLHGRDLSSPTPPTKQSPCLLLSPFFCRIIFSKWSLELGGEPSCSGPRRDWDKICSPIRAQLGISLGPL